MTAEATLYFQIRPHKADLFQNTVLTKILHHLRLKQLNLKASQP